MTWLWFRSHLIPAVDGDDQVSPLAPDGLVRVLCCSLGVQNIKADRASFDVSLGVRYTELGARGQPHRKYATSKTSKTTLQVSVGFSFGLQLLSPTNTVTRYQSPPPALWGGFFVECGHWPSCVWLRYSLRNKTFQDDDRCFNPSADAWRAALHKHVLVFACSGLGKTHMRHLLRQSGDLVRTIPIDYRMAPATWAKTIGR